MKLARELENCCVLLMCGVLFGLAGCSDKEEKPLSNIATPAQPGVLQPAVIVASRPLPNGVSNSVSSHDDEKGIPAIAMKDNCTACHAINKKIVGPTWMNVSVRYKDAAKFEYNGKEYPLVEGLVLKVSLGGSGHWGALPMPPNDSKGIKQEEIKELVQFVLGLAK